MEKNGMERAAAWNRDLAGLPAEDILQFASLQLGEKLFFASSLGAEDQVITSLIAKHSLNISIFTLDTGRLFPETLQLLDRTVNALNIPIRVFFPDRQEVEEMVNEKGINLFYDSVENRKLCCRIRKVNLLNRALTGCSAWLTGIRRSQSENRAGMDVFEWDENTSRMKINPLLNWTLEEVFGYLHKNAVPYNPLHDKGFVSIGCAPCTRAVKPGQDFRDGRWWWENSSGKECGLHTSEASDH